MATDVKQVLKMLEDGVITADEAHRLIEAIDSTNKEIEATATSSHKGKGRFIRVRVTEKGKQKVNINIPLSIVNVATKIIPKLIPYDEIPGGEDLKELDWDEIIAAIKDGASGKLVDIQDKDDIVEVYVE